MEPLEYSEEPVGVIHIETNAIITHLKNNFAVLNNGADFNFGRVTRTAVFERISHQIRPDVAQKIPVAQYFWQGLNIPYHVSMVQIGLQLAQCFLYQRIHGDGVSSQFRPANARER